MIDYTHSRNMHGLEGPKHALKHILDKKVPASFLDVGCGTGTWMKAAIDAQIREVQGIDGIVAPSEELAVPENLIQQQDLTEAWTLKRSYDIAVCMEVAEHLDEDGGKLLIEHVCKHSNFIVFSAAAPFQNGDHHINCQWPAYWQHEFNLRGFSCDDSIRWTLWEDHAIEPWYRQNIFIARPNNRAGNEARIKAVYHPDMLKFLVPDAVFPKMFVKRKSLLRRIFG